MVLMYGGKEYRGELIQVQGREFLWFRDVGVKIPLFPKLAMAA